MQKIIILIAILIFSITNASAKDIWYCPMHPHYTSDKPGNCPICGMTLVKKENATRSEDQHESQVAGYVPIHIDSAKQKLMGLQTTKVVRKPFVKTIRTAGWVAYDEELYKAEVQYVDDYIALQRLDRRLNKGSYTIVDAQRKLKQEELDLEHMGASHASIEQLRQDKFPNHGLLVPEGGDVQIYAQIFEDDLGFVDVGQKAFVEVAAYHTTLEGVVTSLDPIVDATSRSVRAHIKLSRVRDELKSNMFVNVTMPVELDNTLLVPRDALVMTGTRAIAFIKTAEENFVPQEVQTGWESDGVIEVKSGLTEGQEIVSGSNFLVDSESRMQAALVSFDK